MKNEDDSKISFCYFFSFIKGRKKEASQFTMQQILVKENLWNSSLTLDLR